jgi:hypothetical protein
MIWFCMNIVIKPNTKLRISQIILFINKLLLKSRFEKLMLNEILNIFIPYIYSDNLWSKHDKQKAFCLYIIHLYKISTKHNLWPSERKRISKFTRWRLNTTHNILKYCVIYSLCKMSFKIYESIIFCILKFDNNYFDLWKKSTLGEMYTYFCFYDKTKITLFIKNKSKRKN